MPRRSCSSSTGSCAASRKSSPAPCGPHASPRSPPRAAPTVIQTEGAIKLAHLRLLVQEIKNLLSAAQQAQLDGLRTGP